MTEVGVMRRRRYVLALLMVLALALPISLAQTSRPNERQIKPEPNIQDPDEIFGPDGKPKPDSKIWVLNFSCYDPRVITAEVPKRGRRVCWYMLYRVANYTNEPHDFIPDFELVTHDKHTTHHDEIFPGSVQEQIRKIEDPTGYYDIKNSVTIYEKPIPPSKPDATPRYVTGVAIWVLDEKDQDTNDFSIFVTGLSNGSSVDDNGVIRRKTLRLHYKRPGDRFYQHSGEFRFAPPAEWLYRATSDRAAGPKKEDKEAPKGGAAGKPK